MKQMIVKYMLFISVIFMEGCSTDLESYLKPVREEESDIPRETNSAPSHLTFAMPLPGTSDTVMGIGNKELKFEKTF
ncbi:hypothetical protein [Sulfurovum sp.]|uniref:hypothetical protein n=1 Tax=Sulfurovum sp. TaxID=1969726 RepID=UPI0025FF5694|nr:hypothetical protein [Sulfurovum sp.]